MVTKSQQFKSIGSILRRIRYLGDPHHRNHRNKIVCEPRVYNLPPGMSIVDFIRRIYSFLEKANASAKPGRKVERLAFDEMIRPPFDADLTSEELDFIEKEGVKGLVGPNVVVVARHLDCDEGSSDMHFLKFAFDQFGRLIPDRDHLPKLRAVADRVHKKINDLRKKELRPLIETVPEVRRRKKKEKKFRALAKELSGLKSPPTNPSELKAALTSLGYVLTRFNIAKDYLSASDSDANTDRHSISRLIELIAILAREQSIDRQMENNQHTMKDSEPSI